MRTMVKHKSRGVTSGVGICTYFCHLFKLNELAPKRKKLTDEQIAIAIEKEYPGRASASFRGKEKRRTINEYRHKYNRGIFTKGKVPEVFSYRYDGNGDIVDFRTGTKLLSAIQIRGLESAHRYWRNHGR